MYRWSVRPEAGISYLDPRKFSAPVLISVELRVPPGVNGELKRLYLDVRQSRSDNRPLLGISGASEASAEFPGGCDNSGRMAQPFEPVLQIYNTGWSKVLNPKLEFSFVAPGGIAGNTRIVSRIDDFASSAELNFRGILEEMGVSRSSLDAWAYECPSGDQLGTCQAVAKMVAPLGPLRPYAHFLRGSRHLVADTAGTLNFDYLDHAGSRQSSSLAFRASLHLGSITYPSPPECGDGPDAPKAASVSLDLASDKAGYIVEYKLSKPLSLRPGTKKISFGLQASKASRHVFKVVGELADSTRVGSLPVELTYLRFRDPPNEVYGESEVKQMLKRSDIMPGSPR